ncbi:MAG: DEAD/DEAH box helicase, partial [Candidatus Lokiarchaeota archaeon]|nr:DEAD/DEAH box helicase [Candidatus Lokiarchaeota archaeon]
RETKSAVVRHLALSGIDLELRNLKVGDYVISDKVGIERKEAVDFNESLKDGRLFDELYNLKLNFDVAILILEESPIGATGISREAILGSLAAIIANMSITVFSTKSAEETANFITALVKKIQAEKESRPKIIKKKTGSKSEVQEQMIGSIPGINLYRAQDLLVHFSNIKNIVNAEEEKLREIPGIGKTTAKKIKNIVEHNYNDDSEE